MGGALFNRSEQKEDESMSEFSELLDELNALESSGESLRKSLSGDDDDRIKNLDKHGEDDDEDDYDYDDDDGDDDEVLGKSFGVTLEDGSEVEAYDGTALLKSMAAKLDVHDRNSQQVAEAMGAISSLIKSQQDSMGALTKRVVTLTKALNTMANKGAGRRSTINVHEKLSALDGSAVNESLDAGSLMTKANSAFDQGKITGSDLNTLSVQVRRGEQPDARIVGIVTGE
jgi:hypothetical protein